MPGTVAGSSACKKLEGEEHERHTQSQWESLRGMMLAEDQRRAAQAAAGGAALRPKRMSNMDVLYATSNALWSGLELSLKHFVYERPPAALTATQKRKFRLYEWPEGGPPRRRAVIEDSDASTRRWEVPIRVCEGEHMRKAMHLVTDQCSKGWHMATYLFCGKPQLRGTFMLDRLHTTLNLAGEARAAAGFALSQLEWTAAINANKGPRGGHGHYRTLQQSANMLFGVLTAGHPMFVLLYPEIARDLSMDDTMAFGSEAHQTAVFEEMKARFQGFVIGRTARKDRWFTYEYGFRQMRPLFTTMLLVILYWGSVYGHWKSLETSPARFFADADGDGYVEIAAAVPALQDDGAEGGAVAEGEDEAGAAADPAEAAAEGAPLTRAAARRKLKEKKDETPKQLVFAAHVFAGIWSKRQMDGALFLMDSYEQRFHKEMQWLHTMEGSRHLLQNLGEDGFADVYKVVFENFFSCEMGKKLFLSRLPTQHVINRTCAVGQRLYLYACRAIGNWEVLNLMYTETPPLCFMRLVGEDQQRVAAGQLLRRGWMALQRLEQQALRNLSVATFVKELYFPSMGFVRELWVGLEEMSWDGLPPHLVDDVEKWMQVLPSTLMNENLNKWLRRCERESNTQRLGAKGAWHRLLSSPEWSNFERPLLPRTNTARAAARSSAEVLKAYVNPIGADAPFDQDTLADLTASKPSFANLSPENYRLHAMAWQLALETLGEWDLMSP